MLNKFNEYEKISKQLKEFQDIANNVTNSVSPISNKNIPSINKYKLTKNIFSEKDIRKMKELISDASKIRQSFCSPSLSHIISMQNNLSSKFFPFDDKYIKHIKNNLNSFSLNNWCTPQNINRAKSVINSNHLHFINTILTGNKKAISDINISALTKPYTILNAKIFTVMYNNYIDVINSFNLKTKAFKCINKLQKHDWMLPIEKLSDEEFMDKIINLSEDEIESFMLNYYQNNEFQMIKKNLKDIINNMDSLDDYRKQGNINNLLFALDTFSKNPSNFTPHFSNLLGIIEYLNLIGNDFKAFINTKECSNNKAINRKFLKYEEKHIQNHFKYNSNRIISKYYLLSYNAYPIALDLYENFDENDGEKLNRNTIQHGKANFEAFSIKDFITLIVLCNVFSVLASYK